ncbi:MAG: Fe(3+) ABC transporter substrate-binding protein [Pseudomonadota bacterium]
MRFPTLSLRHGVLASAALLMAFATPVQAAEVNVYSGRHYDTDRQVYDLFTERTGIKVNIIEGKSDALLERIKSEGTASPADMLITVDAGRLWRAEQAGLFQAVRSDTLNDNIPASLRHPDGLWYGLSKRVRGIIYSKERLGDATLPATYEEMADPKYKGEVCIRSSNNIYNQSLLGSIIAAHGEDVTRDWAQGIKNNLARPPQGGDTDQIKAVAAGECDYAIANHYYYIRLARSGDAADRAVADKVGFIAPNQDDRGVHANISGAGVLKTAPNPSEARQLLEFLSSADAQAIFARSNNEYPTNPNVAPIAEMELVGEYKQDELNASVFGANNPKALMIADQVGWP